MSLSSLKSPAELLLVESACDQFERALRSGTHPTISEFIESAEGQTRKHLIGELLKIEWDFRAEQNDAPQIKDYQSENLLPALELKSLFDSWLLTQDRPTRIGHFRLIKKLGCGSFGTVWKAEDQRLNREVALKVAHLRFRENADRFLREAKAAARLSYPGIVKILDTGQWEGRLCIVQEYVEGQSLDRIIAERPLSFSRSAELCLALSDALTYSHRHGCIHRDIKPQNVIVQPDGTPVLIDFGLAKNPAATHGTRSGEIIGTPVCMSPEQARGSSHLADARSDIYSLGVILYQMLTGELPFRGSFEMILLQVLNQDPPHPRKLNRDIPTDLATICLKCLEKEPRRRYATASDLSDDLRRFLEGRSVKARPVGAAYRAYRTTVRNPIPSALILTLVLFVGFVISNSVTSARRARSAWQQEMNLRVEAVEARQLAERHAQHAKTEARLARQVTRFLEDVFSLDDPIGNHNYSASSFAGTNIDTSELLARAVFRIDRELTEQPRVQLRLLDIIGNAYRSLGEFEEAVRLMDRSESIRTELAAQHPQWDMRRETATHLFYRGWMHQSLGNYDTSLDFLNRSHAIYQTFLDPDDLKLADVCFQLGWLHLEWRQPELAKNHFEEALRIRRIHLPNNHRLVWSTQLGRAMCNPGSSKNIMALAIAALDMKLDPQLAQLAFRGGQIISAKASGDQDEAERLYRQVLPMLEERLTDQHYVYLLCAGDFASILLDQGHYTEALDYIEPVIHRGRMLAPRHPHLIRACRKLGFEKYLAGRHHDAKKLFQYALDRTPPDSKSYFDLCTFQIANSIELAEYRVAQQLFEQIEIPKDRTELRAWYLVLQAKTQHGLGNTQLGTELDRQAWQEAEKLTMSYQAAIWLGRFAEIYVRANDFETAEELLRKAIDQATQSRPKDHPRISDPLFDLGRLLVQQSRYSEGLPLLKESLRIRESRLPESDQRIAEAKVWIAKANQAN